MTEQAEVANPYRPARFALGFLSLLLRGTSELTRIAAEIHHAFSDKPSIFDQKHQPNLEQAPKTYQLVHLGLIHISNKIHKLLQLIPYSDKQSSELIRLQGVMNGVIGDKLRDWNHPARIEMQLYNADGEQISLSAMKESHPNGIALFVHGLCLTEQEWKSPALMSFKQALRQQGVGSVYVRYNSGLTLAENGKLLSALLEEHITEDQKLLMVGHSMGGLVIRSALVHAAHIDNHQWISSVSHAAYLASPHHGANLEKLGEYANSTLGVSPYSMPLMALGNIRSRGIRSLRNSNLIEQDNHDKLSPYYFIDHVQHLVVGTRLPNKAAETVLGDGLVTETSAMGYEQFPQEHDNVQRLMFSEVGHLKLLSDQRLAWALTLWLSK
ncbi:MAG: GPI inositol-deacylase [Pseudomonadales bacterium]|nr:GPI inositol-deacylase [Pseudomonadales bacterium]